MRQAASEAESPEGLRLGPAEDLEFASRLSEPGESDSEADDEDEDMLAEYTGGAGAEATFSRAQLREILARQRGRVRAAAKDKRRAGSVRQPVFAKR